ncbi:MAG: hypothetical protein HY698_14925 [Deltaproteobacteria bacterium]|nr:hypothetical protein [Deltaproteobacteria bacterium]
MRQPGKLYALARELWGLRDTLISARRERRERIAALFQKIAQCLDEVEAKLLDNEVPHGQCEQLYTYVQELPGVIESVVGAEKARKLGERLTEAYDVEMLYADLRLHPAERERELVALARAAGQLRALADIIAAG